MANMAARLHKAGAKGLVLFNRFLQPDIALEDLAVAPHLVLSTSDELRLALRWIAILRGRVGASLAATGGAHTPEDVLKHREALPEAEIHVWPDAGHGFNCDQRDSYSAGTAQEALNRTLAFLQKNVR